MKRVEFENLLTRHLFGELKEAEFERLDKVKSESDFYKNRFENFNTINKLLEKTYNPKILPIRKKKKSKLILISSLLLPLAATFFIVFRFSDIFFKDTSPTPPKDVKQIAVLVNKNRDCLIQEDGLSNQQNSNLIASIGDQIENKRILSKKNSFCDIEIQFGPSVYTRMIDHANIKTELSKNSLVIHFENGTIITQSEKIGADQKFQVVGAQFDINVTGTKFILSKFNKNSFELKLIEGNLEINLTPEKFLSMFQLSDEEKKYLIEKLNIRSQFKKVNAGEITQWKNFEIDEKVFNDLINEFRKSETISEQKIKLIQKNSEFSFVDQNPIPNLEQKDKDTIYNSFSNFTFHSEENLLNTKLLQSNTNNAEIKEIEKKLQIIPIKQLIRLKKGRSLIGSIKTKSDYFEILTEDTTERVEFDEVESISILGKDY